MRLLVVLGLVAAAMSAPIKEQVPDKVADMTEGEMDHSVSKRTDEQIFYGNQQNAPRDKKSDPEVDPRGFVRALPADAVPMAGANVDTSEEVPGRSEKPQKTIDTAEQQNVETPVQTMEDLTGTDDETPVKTIEDLTGTNDETPVKNMEDLTGTNEETPVQNMRLKQSEAIGAYPVEDIAEPIETDLIKTKTSSEESTGDIEPDSAEQEGEGSGAVDDYSKDKMTFEDLEKLYNEQESGPRYDYYYPDYYLNYRKKRNSGDGNMEVKRSHRAKRDLGYGDFLDYFPSTLDDEQYYDVYRKRQMEDELNESVARQLAPLLAGYGQYAGGEYPERYDNPEYLEYLPDNTDGFEDSSPYDDSWETEDEWGTLSRPSDNPYRTLFRSQPTSFLPIKRQMLSMVPGSRRKRFNYPYAVEPNSHWGAFVDDTQKREHEAAYERLYRLARALATKRSPYGAYLEDLDEYKKK